MGEAPVFTKMDRYKASSLQAFNTKWPERYDSCFWVRFWASRWDREVITELAPHVSSLRVLDIGCATGRLLSDLAKAGARQLAAADLAPRILEVAQRKLAEVGVEADLKVADAEDHLPWPDASFDVATLTGVLHHFYRPADALREIRRVLCPRGRLLIIDPWFPPLLRQLSNVALRFISHDGDCHFYAPSQVVRLLASQGFAQFRWRRVVWHSFLVTALKSA